MMGTKRKAGTGSVHLRKDGRWEGRVVIGYDDRHWPKTKNVLAKTKAECLRKLRALREEVTEKEKPEAPPIMTLGEWLDFWYRTYSKPALRPSTQEIYENWIYNHLTPELGKIPLAELTTSDLQKFFTGMKNHGRLIYADQHGEGLSDRSVQACKIVCGKALDKAVQERRIHDNPILGCRFAQQKPKEMRTLDPDEMQRLLLQAKEEGFYELILLELATGMRRGELLALKWEDLDLTTGELRIEKQAHSIHGKMAISEPKTRAGCRTIILPPSVLEVMRAYRKTVFAEWIFPSPRKPAQPLDTSYVQKRLHAMLRRAECKDIRFHDLRHTFATVSLEHGMDVKTLSAIIGHSSSATTLDVYTHITSDMQRRAALRIDQGIAGIEGLAPHEQVEGESVPTQDFTPIKGKRRRPGTGCITHKSENLWEGRYSPRLPDGSRYVKDVYATTKEECEKKLAALILEMKKEVTEIRLQHRPGAKFAPL